VAPTNSSSVKKVVANAEPSTHGEKWTSRRAIAVSVYDSLLKRSCHATSASRELTEYVSQGLSMFNKQQQLVASISKYLELYDLSPDAFHLGCSLKAFLATGRVKSSPKGSKRMRAGSGCTMSAATSARASCLRLLSRPVGLQIGRCSGAIAQIRRANPSDVLELDARGRPRC